MAPASDTEKVARFRIRGRALHISLSLSLYIQLRLHTPSPLDDTMLTRARSGITDTMGHLSTPIIAASTTIEKSPMC